MDERVFRSKLLHRVSIVFFIITTLFLILGMMNEIKTLNLIYLLILSILSLIVCIKLLNKKRNVIVLINTFILLLLPFILYYSFSVYPTHFIYEPENLFFCCLLIIYMLWVNKNKIDNKGIDEINEIGKNK